MNGIMCGGDTAGCGSAGEVDSNRSTIYSQAGVDLAFAAITAGVDLHRKPEPEEEEYEEAAFVPRSSTIYFDPEDDFEGFDAAGSTTLYLLDPPKRPDDWGDLDTGDFLFAPLSGGGEELDEFFETIGGPGGPKVLVSC